jgi:hypothetical protein
VGRAGRDGAPAKDARPDMGNAAKPLMHQVAPVLQRTAASSPVLVPERKAQPRARAGIVVTSDSCLTTQMPEHSTEGLWQRGQVCGLQVKGHDPQCIRSSVLKASTGWLGFATRHAHVSTALAP